jgi:hypothetical protein
MDRWIGQDIRTCTDFGLVRRNHPPSKARVPFPEHNRA